VQVCKYPLGWCEQDGGLVVSSIVFQNLLECLQELGGMFWSKDEAGPKAYGKVSAASDLDAVVPKRSNKLVSSRCILAVPRQEGSLASNFGDQPRELLGQLLEALDEEVASDFDVVDEL